MHFLAILSMKNRALIALVTIVVGGLRRPRAHEPQAGTHPLDRVPAARGLTTYPGASPEVVNDDVSTPIETAIQGVAGIETTTATSSTNLSIISATFTYGTDLATAEQKISGDQPHQVDAARRPRPQVLTGGIDDFPVVQIAVTGSTATPTPRRSRVSCERTPCPTSQTSTACARRSSSATSASASPSRPTPRRSPLAGLPTQAIRTPLSDNGMLFPGRHDSPKTARPSPCRPERSSRASTTSQRLPLVGEPRSPAAASTDRRRRDRRADRRPRHLDLAGQRQGRAHHRRSPSSRREHGRGVERGARPAADARVGARRRRPSPSCSTRRRSSSSRSSRSPTRGCSASFFAVIVILVFLLSIRSTLVTAISIPTSRAHHLHRPAGGRLHAQHPHPRRAHDRDRPRGRRLDRRDREHQAALASLDGVARMQGGRARHAQPLIVEAVREVAGAITASTITTVAVFLPLGVRRGHHGRAVPALRPDRDHRAARLARSWRSRSCRCSRTGSCAHVRRRPRARRRIRPRGAGRPGHRARVAAGSPAGAADRRGGEAHRAAEALPAVHRVARSSGSVVTLVVALRCCSASPSRSPRS